MNGKGSQQSANGRELFRLCHEHNTLDQVHLDMGILSTLLVLIIIIIIHEPQIAAFLSTS